MKKTLATTIAIASIIVLLFFASCRGDYEDSIKAEEDLIEDEEVLIWGDCEDSIKAEEAREEAIENESGEKVEKDPEESETSTASDGDEENTSTDNEPVEMQPDNGEECNCSDDEEFKLISSSKGSDLPEGFPENTPIHNDIQVTGSSKTLIEGKYNYSVSAVSDKSVDEIINWYKSELPASGWEISNEYTYDIYNMDEGKASGIIAEDGVNIVDIKVMDSEDGGTVVIHNVEER